MCLATGALILGGIGAATSAYGTVEQGQATAQAAQFQSQVAANNAIVEQENAQYAMAAGQQQAAASSLKGGAQAGAIKAAEAANGVDVNSGSNLDVQVSQRDENQLSTENVLNNAALQAYGYRTGAVSQEAQSGLEELTAEQAPVGADLSAAGGLLGNAAGLGLKWNVASNGGLSGTNWSGVG
jgi:hypothetical protein